MINEQASPPRRLCDAFQPDSSGYVPQGDILAAYNRGEITPMTTTGLGYTGICGACENLLSVLPDAAFVPPTGCEKFAKQPPQQRQPAQN